MDWSTQRYWEDVAEGDEVRRCRFPLSVYRLVVGGGANRDFNSYHHNTEYAQKTAHQRCYANNIFLQGMWERTARELWSGRGHEEPGWLSYEDLQYRG